MVDDAFEDSIIDEKEQHFDSAEPVNQTTSIETQPNTTQTTEMTIDDVADSTTCTSTLMINHEHTEVDSHEAANMDDAIQNDLLSAQQTDASTVAPAFQHDAQQIPNDFDNGCIPTATSSCISNTESNNATPKLNDTTQELNLDAFNSDSEDMDKLEFASSESPTSSDSGNITANTSCAITVENVSENQTNSLMITSAALETDAIHDEQSMTTENELIQDHPEPSSTSRDSFVRAHANSDTIESNLSSEVSTTGSTMFQAQSDTSYATSEKAQENVVSTSNEGTIAEPSMDYVESAQSIHSMATCSTPARAFGKFSTSHIFDRSMQQNMAQELGLQTSKYGNLTTEIESQEQENMTEVSMSKYTNETVENDTVLADPESDITIDQTTLAETFENIEATQSTDDIFVQQQNHELVSASDENQSKRNGTNKFQ